MTHSIEHNANDERYEIYVDDELAGFTEARVLGDTVLMPHTLVLEKFSGQGLGGELVGAALDDIRSSGRSVRPTCTYVRGYIAKHPEYADLLAPEDS